MASVMYYDTLLQAQGKDLSSYTDVFTLGYSKKNDGGGAHYKKYDAQPDHGLRFDAQDVTVMPHSATTHWGLVPDSGVVNPLQAGAIGDGDPDHNDRDALQACIDFIQWWAEASGSQTVGDLITVDSSRTAVKLIIPGGDHVFVVDRRDPGPDPKGNGLDLTAPITIEGEDRLTSRIRFLETTNESDEGGPADGTSHGQANSLFYTSRELMPESSTDALITGITLRNFTITGSYGNPDLDDDDTVYQSNGNASILTVYRFDDVLLENMVFEKNRAVMINGGQTRNFTMRGCLMSECRRGGLIITDAENVVVEDNDFRWVSDDPVAITMGADPATVDDDGAGPHVASSGNATYLAAGGLVRIVGNRCFGSRGLNVVGSKNVLIADNTHVLGKGRAIHIGCVTDQDKGDTSTLNVIVRNNIITDLLDSAVDPDAEEEGRSSHRAIDIEMLQTAPNPVGTPGLPDSSGVIADPEPYYYTEGQGLQGGSVWKPATDYAEGERVWALGRLYEAQNDGTSGATPPTFEGMTVPIDGAIHWTFLQRTVTPHSGNILVEGNVISRTRTAVAAFTDYGVGDFGGFPHVYDGDNPVGVTDAEIRPDEGIAVAGSVRNLIIRGNQVRNCEVAILLSGRNLPVPLSLYDVRIEGNDLSDWSDAAIRFEDYDLNQPQRVSILNNRLDGDPFHRAAGRNGDGTWSSGGCVFVATNSLLGLIIAGNHVRNVGQLISNFGNAKPTMQDNVGYCNPAALGFNNMNVGIGNLIAPQLGWRYVVEDGNPGSATFGKVLNSCPLATTGVPTSGAWVEGTFVKKLAPSAGTITIGTAMLTYEVAGWRRVTTSQTNLTSEWKEQRVLTG